MPKSTTNKIQNHLGPLETQVMDIVWNQKKSSVREVWSKLEKPLAYTTIMTIMVNLYKKGYLRRDLIDKAYFYRPTLSKNVANREAAKLAIEKLVSSHGHLTTQSAYFLYVLSAFQIKKRVYIYNNNTVVYIKPLLQGIFLATFTTIFLYSSYDLIKNLQFFGSTDYFKYIFTEPELLITNTYIFTVALLESIPVVNLLTSAILLALITNLTKRVLKINKATGVKTAAL